MIAIAIFLIVPNAQAQRDSHVVRAMDVTLAATLDDAYRSSPAMQWLVNELERSDLIVHVVGMPAPLRTHFNGTMQFVKAAGGRRFLRIRVNEQLGAEQRAAALAHELHHALEVSRSIAVVGQASLRVLYRTIGEVSAPGANLECYETDGAIRAGEAVLNDMREDRRRRSSIIGRTRR